MMSVAYVEPVTRDLPMAASIALIAAWLLLLYLARSRFSHIALLGFPGVVLHELMHLLVGLVLLAKPVSMNLIPRRSGNSWLFGSVSFTGLNLLNAAPVAYAPLLLLALAWASFQYWMLPLWSAQHYLMWVLAGYLTSCATFYSLPSLTDIRVGAWSSACWLAVLLGLAYLLIKLGLLH